MREFQRDQRAHRFGHYHSERDRHREFEIAVQREQDEKNQKHRQRPHYLELLLRFEEFGVFAAPVDAIAGWKGFCDIRDGPLPVTHGAFEIASLDAVLHADVAGIVFAIDKGSAGSFLNVGERRERNLLPAGRAHQQIGDLLRVLSELRLHAHHEIEELLALNHLRRRLPAHRRLNHAFHVRHIYAVTRDLLAIHLDQEARLAEFAYHGEFRESGDLCQPPLDLECFILQHVQVGSVDLHRERALQPSERFVDGIFRGLGVIENHAGIRFELLLQLGNQRGFIVNGTLFPRGVIVWFQPHIKFAIEETGGIGAVVRTAQLRAYFRHLGILRDQCANLRRELARLFVRNRVRQCGAHPQRSFVEMRHELAADERNEKQRRAENQRGHDHRGLRMVEAPRQLLPIFFLDPFERLVPPLAHAFLEPVRTHHRHERQREDERADQRHGHRVRHGVEELAGGTAERIDRNVTGDNHRHRIENRPVHVLRRFQNHFVEVVLLPFAFAEHPKNVLHHHQRAVDHDSEIDRADR